MPPADAEDTAFSPDLYKHTLAYLKQNDPKMIYIYGDIDPWSASGIYGLPFTKHKQNLQVYMLPGGSHRTRIMSFPESTREEIIRQIEDWLKLHVTFSSFVLLYM